LILWMGARHVMQGTLTVGGLLAFLAWLSTMQAQLKIFTQTYTSLQGFGASVDRVMEILEADPEVAERPGAGGLGNGSSPVRGRVCFEGVEFAYEPGQPVLRGVTLTVEPGQTVAIIGATGAGKSTLVNLIPRFFDPCQGRVCVDGTDIREVTLRSLRRQIAFVPQELFLVPGSLAENIAYGKPDATREQIVQAARIARAHDFIARLPQGYDSPVGERGATLSGGERQRLSLARALLMDAPILILDEPTSAVDAGTEHDLLANLQNVMRGRTTFLIAHRLATVRHAGRILVLKGGQITEDGSHQSLMAQNGIYASLHRLQFNPSMPVEEALGRL
jgi:ATP-binding cassette subfamily B protein/subfamily B ATP-binding cassette protein MsbA